MLGKNKKKPSAGIAEVGRLRESTQSSKKLGEMSENAKSDRCQNINLHKASHCRATRREGSEQWGWSLNGKSGFAAVPKWNKK